jgi:hypothetical protein
MTVKLENLIYGQIVGCGSPFVHVYQLSGIGELYFPWLK